MIDKLLRPLFDRLAQRTTFINGIDLVRQLNSYRDNDHLLPTTYFITFDVTDLYTMIPKSGAVEALGRFLIQNSMKDTNYFVCNNKYYRQINDGIVGSTFAMTLVNVYMLEWKQSLIELQIEQGKFYSR
ncbi:unnamed protein product [Adineta ricciae]|uniref:Reverse transcriptase domain-containing protein n=1 Tax=Adineta ricciae TaxID=249248 RepID=A0A816GMK4_ADIRI|nr:unnamed protein product [Adineta ricciae]CAF1675927.1 unnamed protein product [Adineta ricciae]